MKSTLKHLLIVSAACTFSLGALYAAYVLVRPAARGLPANRINAASTGGVHLLPEVSTAVLLRTRALLAVALAVVLAFVLALASADLWAAAPCHAGAPQPVHPSGTIAGYTGFAAHSDTNAHCLHAKSDTLRCSACATAGVLLPATEHTGSTLALSQVLTGNAPILFAGERAPPETPPPIV